MANTKHFDMGKNITRGTPVTPIEYEKRKAHNTRELLKDEIEELMQSPDKFRREILDLYPTGTTPLMDMLKADPASDSDYRNETIQWAKKMELLPDSPFLVINNPFENIWAEKEEDI